MLGSISERKSLLYSLKSIRGKRKQGSGNTACKWAGKREEGGQDVT